MRFPSRNQKTRRSWSRSSPPHYAIQISWLWKDGHQCQVPRSLSRWDMKAWDSLRRSVPKLPDSSKETAWDFCTFRVVVVRVLSDVSQSSFCVFAKRVVVECEACNVYNLYCPNGPVKVQGMSEGADGFFAEYAVVDYRNAMVLPESIKSETASPLFCGGIAGESAFSR